MAVIAGAVSHFSAFLKNLKFRKMDKKEYFKEYMTRPIWRAINLVNRYNWSDKEKGRGKGDLTAKWILENILTKPCAHCGKTGWKVIGCNRLDNSKPHTMDNVEPCCKQCNDKLSADYTRCLFGECVDQIDKITGEVVKTWNCISYAEKYGFNEGQISRCCKGGFFSKSRNKWVNVKQHKGYIWKKINRQEN